MSFFFYPVIAVAALVWVPSAFPFVVMVAAVAVFIHIFSLALNIRDCIIRRKAEREYLLHALTRRQTDFPARDARQEPDKGETFPARRD